MVGQSLIAAINMGSQILGVPLYVHIRPDIGAINQIGLFVIYFIVLHYAFKSGFGIYSMLLNQAVGIVWGISFTVVSCLWLGYYPKRGCYKLPSREEWKSVWSYSRGVFIIQLGGLLISSMPQLIIARMLGLESGATWAVATRPFVILRQIVCKPFEVALPMIYDAYIRKEMETVTRQWSMATQMVLAACGVVFSVAAANNPVFLDLWTLGRIHWEPLNHWMLAGFFYFSIMGGLAFGSIGMDKSIGSSKYINFAQAALTLALAVPLTANFGFPGLMLALAIPYIPGMTVFGVRYLGSITGKPALPLAWAAIVRPTLIVPLCAAAAWACSQMTHWLPGYFGLMLSASCGTASAMALMATFGVSKDVRIQFGSFAARLFQKIALKRVAEV
jgi:O-antigen/teichoic acid export membrane protein